MDNVRVSPSPDVETAPKSAASTWLVPSAASSAGLIVIASRARRQPARQPWEKLRVPNEAKATSRLSPSLLVIVSPYLADASLTVRPKGYPVGAQPAY
jgi:hypothetical protein